MPLPTAVIFDMNGVIADDEPVHHRLFARILEPLGIALPWEEYEARYLALDDAGVLEAVCASHGRPLHRTELRELVERKAGLYHEGLDAIRLFDGTVDLMRRLSAELPVAVCSGALRREVDAILAKAGLAGAVTATVAAEETEQHKPAPEPYLLAARRLEQTLGHPVPPESCAAVEDSPAGIESARAAGMKVLALTHSYPPHRLGRAHRVAADAGLLAPEDFRALFRKGGKGGHSTFRSSEK